MDTKQPCGMKGWEPYQEELRRRYIEDNDTLETIAQYFKGEYGFVARYEQLKSFISSHITEGNYIDDVSPSERQYKKFIRHKGWHKSCKAENWKALAGHLKERRRQGKKSEEVYNRSTGKLITQKTIQKRVREQPLLSGRVSPRKRCY